MQKKEVFDRVRADVRIPVPSVWEKVRDAVPGETELAQDDGAGRGIVWTRVLAVAACAAVVVGTGVALNGLDRNAPQTADSAATQNGGPSTSQNSGAAASVKTWYDFKGNGNDNPIPPETMTLTIAEFPDVTFEFTGTSVSAVKDGVRTELYSATTIWNVYLTDLTGDGKPEFCSAADINPEAYTTEVFDHAVTAIDVYDYAAGKQYELASPGIVNYGLMTKNENMLTVTSVPYGSGDGSCSLGTLAIKDSALVMDNPIEISTNDPTTDDTITPIFNHGKINLPEMGSGERFTGIDEMTEQFELGNLALWMPICEFAYEYPEFYNPTPDDSTFTNDNAMQGILSHQEADRGFSLVILRDTPLEYFLTNNASLATKTTRIGDTNVMLYKYKDDTSFDAVFMIGDDQYNLTATGFTDDTFVQLVRMIVAPKDTDIALTYPVTKEAAIQTARSYVEANTSKDTTVDLANPDVSIWHYDATPDKCMLGGHTSLDGKDFYRISFKTSDDAVLGPITLYINVNDGEIYASDYRE
ncbi:MAG: hypothetical protein QM689_01335 [Oscillospiraceae bacterium]